jgi:hypothetical protein
VANAFGAFSGTTYTRGLGIPEAIAMPSTMLCRRGCSSGVTSFARAEARTSLSPHRYDENDRNSMTTRAMPRPTMPEPPSRIASAHPTPTNSTIMNRTSSTVLRLFLLICSYTGA